MHVGSSWDIAELTAIPCQVTAALKVSLPLAPWLKQTLGYRRARWLNFGIFAPDQASTTTENKSSKFAETRILYSPLLKKQQQLKSKITYIDCLKIKSCIKTHWPLPHLQLLLWGDSLFEFFFNHLGQGCCPFLRSGWPRKRNATSYPAEVITVLLLPIKNISIMFQRTRSTELPSVESTQEKTRSKSYLKYELLTLHNHIAICSFKFIHVNVIKFSPRRHLSSGVCFLLLSALRNPQNLWRWPMTHDLLWFQPKKGRLNLPGFP